MFQKKRKVTCSAEGNKAEIDFVLEGKDHRKYVKLFPKELQHR